MIRRGAVNSDFSIEIREQERAVVLALRGELDLASGPPLEEAIERAIGSRAQVVTLDLGELQFMDVTSLRLLVATHRRAEKSGKRLVLVNVRGPVRRLLTLTRVIDTLTVIDDPHERTAGE